jgi:hypothetical protein
VLEQCDVARDERGRRKAEDLDIGKVPRHHGEHDADRLEPDVVLDAAGVDRLRREQPLRVVGVVLAEHGRLLDLPLSLAEDLAHLERRLARELRGVRAQGRGERAQQVGALGDRTRAPARERGIGAVDRGSDLLRSRLLVATDLRPIGGIDGNKGHRGGSGCVGVSMIGTSAAPRGGTRMARKRAPAGPAVMPCATSGPATDQPPAWSVLVSAPDVKSRLPSITSVICS